MRFDPAEEISDAGVLEIIKNTIDIGRIIYGKHVKQRMQERHFTTDDVIYILCNGKITNRKFNEENKNWVYKIQGVDLDGDEGAVIAVIISENKVFIVTVTS